MKKGVVVCDNDITVASKILSIRGVQVILDRDIADLYGVETKVLNQAVKRNLVRFPERFRFQVTAHEMSELVTNCDRFKSMKGIVGTGPDLWLVFSVSMLFYTDNENVTRARLWRKTALNGKSRHLVFSLYDNNM